MTSPTKRDIERKLDDLADEGEGVDEEGGLRIRITHRNADGEVVERKQCVLGPSGQLTKASHNAVEENEY